MDGEVRRNPFLSGNYAPVLSEDDFQLKVEGEMPRDLAGALYRNGPNPQFEPRDPHHHWFAGDGMVHGFFIEDGQVRYRNRWVRTPKWKQENAAGQSLYGTFGNPMTTDPSVVGGDSGVANTAMAYHGGRLLALEEGHAATVLDRHSLETLGYHDLGGKVTAHPKEDPVTGELVFFGYMDAPMPLSAKVSYGVADKSGALVRRETFEAPYCSMIHDFMVTPNHVLFPVLPLTGSLERAMTGGAPFAWEPEKPALVGVMRRDAGVETIRWFNTGACYVFHVMNSWEEDGALVADVMRYDHAPLFPRADGAPGERAGAYLVRWTFDMTGATDAIKETQLDDLAGEFPRFDERYAMRKNRHGWFSAQVVEPGEGRVEGLSHIDLVSGRRSDFMLPALDGVSEPVFVPRSADAPEGEGWLLAVAYRAALNTSELMVFDAQNVTAGPVATARTPRRVPYGFHGMWVGA